MEERVQGPVVSVMGFEDGAGEGVGVVLVSEATVITTNATYYPKLSAVTGTWVNPVSAPGANVPSLFTVNWSGDEVYVTAYNIAGAGPFLGGTINVFAKGNY